MVLLQIQIPRMEVLVVLAVLVVVALSETIQRGVVAHQDKVVTAEEDHQIAARMLGVVAAVKAALEGTLVVLHREDLVVLLMNGLADLEPITRVAVAVLGQVGVYMALVGVQLQLR